MNKKIFILSLILLIFFQFTCFAAGGGGEKSVNVDISSLEKFSQKIQQNNDYIPDISFSKMIETYKSTGSVGISLKSFTGSIGKYIFKEVMANSRLLIELLLISLLCALLQNIQNAFSSDQVSRIAYFTCYLVMVVIIIKSFMVAVQLGQDTIGNMVEFTNSMMPALIAILAASGGFASAATLDPLIMFMTKFTSDVIREFILPVTVLVVVIGIVDNLSENVSISKLGSLIKQINLWILGFMMTIFVAVITIRSSTSATLDAVTLKTTKFAVDNFIPVVGKCLSDAISTVAGYSMVLKDAISVAGLIVVVLICIFPLIKIIIISLIYKFVGAVMEPVVDKKVVKCLNATAGSLVIVFVCVLSVAIMFFIMITIIASTGRLVMMVR